MKTQFPSGALALCLAVAACDRDAPTSTNLPSQRVAPMQQIASSSASTGSETERPVPDATPPLWQAGMEAGNLLEWEDNTYQASPCGGAFNNGDGATVPSQDFARTGLWSVKMSIGGDDPASTPNGARLFRWCESQLHRELFYSVWYYFPQQVTVTGWMTLFFFKSKPTPSAVPDPFFYLGLNNVPATGAMRFMLSWWNGLTIEGPSPSQSGFRTWTSPLDIPTGRWFQVQTRYVCDGDFGGAIQVWQDDVEIFQLEGVRTMYLNGECMWGISSYGTGITPSPVIIYVDDAVISQSKIEREPGTWGR